MIESEQPRCGPLITVSPCKKGGFVVLGLKRSYGRYRSESMARWRRNQIINSSYPKGNKKN